MSTMHVELVSVESRIWSGEASAVYARTMEGELGILPGHAPLLGALEPQTSRCGSTASASRNSR